MSLISSLKKVVRNFFYKKNSPELLLNYVHKNRGLLWENIEAFRNQLSKIDGAVEHSTDEMQESFPVIHDLKDGLYTREIFMPKGSLVVSFIHKQNHPSFFLEGEMSILTDAGEVKKIKAPMKVMTETGTQRVAYMHEDCKWVCVYRTDQTEIKEAQKDVYTLNYKDLPELVINKKKLLCQD
jgi:hypothetical protein